MRSAYLSLALLVGANTLAGAQGNEPVVQPPERTASVSRRLSRPELEAYLRDKKVALFGEAHRVNLDGETFDDLRDDMPFRRLLPMLKKIGYTHVALEIEYHHEEQVRRGKETVGQTELGITGATIAPLAVEYGLEVLCIDNRDAERPMLRDEYMEQRIGAVVAKGGRVAYFVGAAHLEMVLHSPNMAAVELNSQLVGQNETVGRKIKLHGAKPLGKRLAERYGTEHVALVNMADCSYGIIPTCFLE